MITNKLNFCSVRISAEKDNGISVGTGFILRFAEQSEEGKYFNVPAIVTNKHVIEGAKVGKIQMHVVDEGGNLAGQSIFTIENFEKQFYFHPDKDVDLCAMPIAILHQLCANDKIKPYYSYLSLKMIPDEHILEKLEVIEDVIVVGYPNGIWDEDNNLPIFRKGIMATHPKYSYNGKQEFLIDCAIFPGSSGSPVFQITKEFVFKNGVPEVKDRILILGIVYATYQHTTEGKVFVKKIPHAELDTKINIPNYLGLVINAKRLYDIDNILRKEFPITDKESIFDAENFKMF